MTNLSVLILHATGTNRDHDVARAVDMAGGRPEIWHVNKLQYDPKQLHHFQMLVLPGGFSYGDDLGAGRLWASDLRWLFQDEMDRFVAANKPVIGICNGFQALVKSGWLPERPDGVPQVTLTRNASNRFECRWVWLEANPSSSCVFTQGVSTRIYCPVAHGEGRFVPRDDRILEGMYSGKQIALTYVGANGGAAIYPENPNGSVGDIAGICNKQGTILGLMPHPENHIVANQHPRWTRNNASGSGLPIFENGVRYASQI